jgi:hypothetical protein
MDTVEVLTSTASLLRAVKPDMATALHPLQSQAALLLRLLPRSKCLWMELVVGPTATCAPVVVWEIAAHVSAFIRLHCTDVKLICEQRTVGVDLARLIVELVARTLLAFVRVLRQLVLLLFLLPHFEYHSMELVVVPPAKHAVEVRLATAAQSTGTVVVQNSTALETVSRPSVHATRLLQSVRHPKAISVQHLSQL